MPITLSEDRKTATITGCICASVWLSDSENAMFVLNPSVAAEEKIGVPSEPEYNYFSVPLQNISFTISTNALLQAATDFRPVTIQALQLLKKKLADEEHQKQLQIDEQISKLLALEAPRENKGTITDDIPSSF